VKAYRDEPPARPVEGRKEPVPELHPLPVPAVRGMCSSGLLCLAASIAVSLELPVI
jgi:hypothetical protein